MNLKRNSAPVVRLVLVSVCTLAIAFLLVPRGAGTRAQNHLRIPMTTDWSTRHMVYSAPSSSMQAWRLQAEPRYLQQWARRHAAALLRASGAAIPSLSNAVPRADWGYPLLSGTGGLGTFPAKFTFDVTAPPDCTNDFVVFNRAGSAGVQPTTAATQNGTFANDPAPGQTVTITSPKASVPLTASATDNTGTNFQVGGGIASDAANLAAAIVRNNAGLGVTATAAGGVVTVTALAIGQEGNLVKLAETLANFKWAGTTLANGVGRGNIIAFNNLYSIQGSSPGGFCNQNGPSVYWSYFTGTGKASTSVVLSGDGTKVAFVEAATTGATLRILKWKAGQGTGAGYPNTVDINVAAGHTWAQDCTAGNSCMSSIPFSGLFNDTGSSPFYDYRSDTLYVGDNSARLHKFTGIFNDSSTPTEVTTAPWPIRVLGLNPLSSPVFDSVSRNIFVGSSNHLSFIREVGSTKGTCVPPCLDPTFQPVGTGGAIVDSPIVDGTTGMVFAVNGTDTSSHGTIVQAPADLSTSVSFAIGGIAGTSNTGGTIYSGDFDNTYFNSSIPNIAGHMYICGKEPTQFNRPAVYQLSFSTTGVLTSVGAPLTGLATADGIACSPVTEFDNPNAGGDWIFFSIGSNANSASPMVGPCATENIGCLISINVTGNPSWPPAAVGHTASLPAHSVGAATGIVVDNDSLLPQASSIYFATVTNSIGAGPGLPSCNTTAVVGCAVKLTQSGLQ